MKKISDKHLENFIYFLLAMSLVSVGFLLSGIIKIKPEYISAFGSLVIASVACLAFNQWRLIERGKKRADLSLDAYKEVNRISDTIMSKIIVKLLSDPTKKAFLRAELEELIHSINTSVFSLQVYNKILGADYVSILHCCLAETIQNKDIPKLTYSEIVDKLFKLNRELSRLATNTVNIHLFNE